MRCRQVRRKYRKYLYGQLPEGEYEPIMKHIHNCPDCAAETSSLEKMRLLLQSANKVDRPSEYWSSYWNRLESKLPEKPVEFTFKSRISDIFHRPVLLGQIAVYILVLAFIIYMVPNHLFREAPKPQTSSKAPTALNEAQSKPESTIAAGREMASEIVVRDVKKIPESPVKHSVAREKTKLGIDARIAEDKEKRAETELAIKTPEPAKPEMKVMYDKVDSLALNENQYAIGEQHFQNGEYLQAIPAYQNFVIANSTDPRALNAQYQIGESYFQMKDYPKAISNFIVVTDGEKSDEIAVKGAAPQKEEAADAITASKAEDKQFAYRARRAETNAKLAPVLRQVVDDGKDSTGNREELIAKAIFRQGESYENLKKREEALEKYREYIRKYPEGEYIKQAKEKITELSK